MNNKETPVFSKKPEIKNPRFVLLLGPSGVGKSTIIKDLHARDYRIQFVSPIMNRPTRPGETEKISISGEAFSDLESQDFFLVVNNAYGNRYGTPRSSIDTILRDGRIPILDYPLDRINQLTPYKNILYNIYVVPPSFGTLHQRIERDERGVNSSRYEEARAELGGLVRAHFKHPDIHDIVINRKLAQSVPKILNLIYNAVT